MPGCCRSIQYSLKYILKYNEHQRNTGSTMSTLCARGAGSAMQHFWCSWVSTPKMLHRDAGSEMLVQLSVFCVAVQCLYSQYNQNWQYSPPHQTPGLPPPPITRHHRHPITTTTTQSQCVVRWLRARTTPDRHTLTHTHLQWGDGCSIREVHCTVCRDVKVIRVGDDAVGVHAGADAHLQGIGCGV